MEQYYSFPKTIVASMESFKSRATVNDISLSCPENKKILPCRQDRIRFVPEGISTYCSNGSHPIKLQPYQFN